MQERADTNVSETVLTFQPAITAFDFLTHLTLVSLQRAANFDPYTRSLLSRTPQLVARSARVRRLAALGSQAMTGVNSRTLSAPDHEEDEEQQNPAETEVPGSMFGPHAPDQMDNRKLISRGTYHFIICAFLLCD